MLGRKLEDLLADRNKTVSELARDTGASAQTLYSIIRRDSMKIDLDLLMRICNSLGVRPEYFSMYSPMSLPDASESDLLRRYRSLDEHGRDVVEQVFQAEERRIAAQHQADTGVKAKIIPLYRTPAAAGYASPALGEDYDDYEVPSDTSADFAARIQGDSMEPFIPDGSVVLVKRGEPMHDGDVGLFFVDGDMKCKQFCRDSQGSIYLFSLNRQRADADVFVASGSGITVLCFGKVLLSHRPPLP